MWFTIICYYLARPPLKLVQLVNSHIVGSDRFTRVPEGLKRWIRLRRMSIELTIAICFCGAAKTTSVGIPLVASMWAHQDDLSRAEIQIPVLLYTMEQVFMAQILVYIFKWYLRRSVKERDEESASSTVTPEVQEAERQSVGGKEESP